VLKTKTSQVEIEAAFTNAVALTGADERNSDVFASLTASLTDIRKLKGVLGFILRSNTSAIIDLNDQDKNIEYAILSSQIQDSSQTIAKQFNLGETESTLLEGESVKMLCMTVGENSISVFMEKSAIHAWIIKRIML
jgi:predicted regulator of Ras-like GTPase activity (Roadblock/LC7/MglB family)